VALSVVDLDDLLRHCYFLHLLVRVSTHMAPVSTIRAEKSARTVSIGMEGLLPQNTYLTHNMRGLLGHETFYSCLVLSLCNPLV
jgi:hypothetical protein